MYTSDTLRSRGRLQVVAGCPTLRRRTTKRKEPCGETAVSRTPNRQLPLRSNPFALSRARTRSPASSSSIMAPARRFPKVVFDAINGHLLHRNVQRGGRYARSMEVDATIARARESVAALINARDPDEIAFGMNATSFLRLLSLAIGRTLADPQRDRRHGPRSRSQYRHLAATRARRGQDCLVEDA